MNAKEKWTIGGFALMAVMVVLTMVLGVLPPVMQATAINARTDQISQGNIERNNFLESLKKTALDKESYFIEVTNQRVLMPTKLNIVEYMDYLGADAKTSGVTLTNLSVQPPAHFVAPVSVTKSAEVAAAQARLANGALFVSELSVSASGSTAQLADFLDRVRLGKRYALVYKVNSAEGEDPKGLMTVDLSIQLFTLVRK